MGSRYDGARFRPVRAPRLGDSYKTYAISSNSFYRNAAMGSGSDGHLALQQDFGV